MHLLVGLIFPGAPGWAELLIVAAILLLLFGNRLPSVMRSMGKGVVEFKKGIQGVEDELTSVTHDKNSEESAPSKQDAE